MAGILGLDPEVESREGVGSPLQGNVSLQPEVDFDWRTRSYVEEHPEERIREGEQNQLEVNHVSLQQND